MCCLITCVIGQQCPPWRDATSANPPAAAYSGPCYQATTGTGPDRAVSDVLPSAALAASSVMAGTSAGPGDDHSDDKKHRPGNDAHQAASGVPPRQVRGMAREERRQRLRRLGVIDDARDDGQNAAHH